MQPDLFEPMFPAVPAHVTALIAAGCLVVINDSGGKDSQAMKAMLVRTVPAKQLLVIHAILEGEEWEGTLEHVQATTPEGIEVKTCRAEKTYEDMVRSRGMFPSPKYRQCTSDLKRDPINKLIRAHLKAHPEFGGVVISAMGLRAQESANRAKAKTWKLNERNSVAGRTWYEWLPIHAMTTGEVFASIQAVGQEPLWVYKAGMKRASCQFCIMACQADLIRAAQLAPAAYQARAKLEREIGFTINMEGKTLPEVTGIAIEDMKEAA